MSLFGADTPGAYGPGAGTIRPPVDDSHKGTFPPGSIFYVCQKGDLPGLEDIVDKALHIRIAAATCSVKEQVMGLSPLHVAAEAGQLEIIEYLLRANVEVKVEDKFLVTPLHLAALEGHLEICAALIKAKAPVAAQDVAGDQPIHWAATKGRDQVIKLLLKAGSPLDAPNNQGWTPLHRAAYAGRTAAARALVEAGANLSARSFRGDSPLHLACFSNAVPAIEELIKKNDFDRNARNCQGLTPFGMCLTDEAKAVMRMYGAEAATDRVRLSQRNLGLTTATGANPDPEQQDGDMLQQHLAKWQAAAMEEGAPGFDHAHWQAAEQGVPGLSRSAQQVACVSSPPQELERQGQGEGSECDISSVEGDEEVDMERLSAELLRRKREIEEFPDPENPGLSKLFNEDTRFLSNDFMAEVSVGFAAPNPYDLVRRSTAPSGGHSQESDVPGAPVSECPSGTSTPLSSSHANRAFPLKRPSLESNATFPPASGAYRSSNHAEAPLTSIAAHPPPGEPRNGRKERPLGPVKHRHSTSFSGPKVPALEKLGSAGARSNLGRASEPSKTGPAGALPPRLPIWGGSPMALRRASESQVSIASRGGSGKNSRESAVVGGGSSNNSSKVSAAVNPMAAAAAMQQQDSGLWGWDPMLNFPVLVTQTTRSVQKPSNLAPQLVREPSRRTSSSVTSLQDVARSARLSSLTNINPAQSKWEHNIRAASDTCFLKLPSLSRAEKVAPGGGALVGAKPSNANSKFLERYSLNQKHQLFS